MGEMFQAVIPTAMKTRVCDLTGSAVIAWAHQKTAPETTAKSYPLNKY